MMCLDPDPHHSSLTRSQGLVWHRAGLVLWVPCGPGPVPSPVQVSAEKKQTGSTVGMQTSVETSTLLKVGPAGAGRDQYPAQGRACGGGQRPEPCWGGQGLEPCCGGQGLEPCLLGRVKCAAQDGAFLVGG